MKKNKYNDNDFAIVTKMSDIIQKLKSIPIKTKEESIELMKVTNSLTAFGTSDFGNYLLNKFGSINLTTIIDDVSIGMCNFDGEKHLVMWVKNESIGIIIPETEFEKLNEQLDNVTFPNKFTPINTIIN